MILPRPQSTSPQAGWLALRHSAHGQRPHVHQPAQQAIPIGDALANELALELLGLPVGSVLDAEWLARRPGWRSEALWVFDVMQLGPLSLWSHATAERLEILQSLLEPERIAPKASGDYGAFYDSVRERGDAEGIVLKRSDAKYIGSFRGCALNPGWVKCKWRGGEDGCTVLTELAAIY